MTALRLRLLGALSLDRSDAPLPPAASQRRRLMLLALLASAGDRGMPRSRVAACLWPESTEERARHALDQLLHAIRRDLACDVIVGAAGTLRLNDALIASDLRAFESAADRRADADAAAAYGGAFLDGAIPPGAPEFERWAEAERDRLQRRYCRVVERLAEAAERAGDTGAAVHRRQQRLALDPCDSSATIALMNATARAGDPAAVQRQARMHARLRQLELGFEADPVVERTAAELVAGLAATSPAAARAEPAGTPAPRRFPGSADAPDVAGTTHTSAPRRRSVVRGSWFRWAAGATPATIMLLLLAGTSASWRAPSLGSRAPATDAATPTAVAVLPLRNMTGDSAAEYLGDGLTEDIIHVLSQVPGLRVVARTSAFTFKQRDDDIRRIGRQLGAARVIEGGIRRVQGRLVATVQLVDVATGYQRWSHRFPVSEGDLAGIAREVAVHMTAPADPAPRYVQQEPPSRAHDDYLRGRFALNAGGADGVARATAHFLSATVADPQFGRAWAALAQAYSRTAVLRTGTPDQPALLARAEAAAHRAIDVDSTLSDAHVAMGEILINRWDWDGAERAVRRAIHANPSSAEAHAQYATLLTLRGRFPDALPALRRAQELDPLSPSVHATAGYLLVLGRRYGDAERLLRTLITADPQRARPHFLLGTALVHTQRYVEAAQEFETAARLAPSSSGALPMLGYTYARSGRLREARGLRTAVERGVRDGSVSPYFTAAYLNELGDRDGALDVLSRLGANRESCLQDLAVDPTMVSLRGEPTFDVVLQAVGLRGRT